MDREPTPDDRRDEHEEENEGERHVVALQKFVGFVMMVLAWLQLLVAVSSGSEADHMPFIYYFLGLVIFINGTVTAWYKYPIMGLATITGLTLIYHIKSIGSAMRWEKELVVYGTIIYIALYMFTTKKPARQIRTPPDQPPSA